MKTIERTNKFKKDYKTVSSWQNFKRKNFEEVISCLVNEEKLSPKYKTHQQTASGVVYTGYWNIHIAPNIILICDIKQDKLTLIRIGSHNSLGITESLCND